LSFDKKRVSAEPNTKQLRIYDLCTNQRFTPKERPMTRADLDDFVACYKSGRRHERADTHRSRCFAYAELVARDKINLDILWLKDDTLDDLDLQPPPDEIAAKIVEKPGGGTRPLPQGRAEPFNRHERCPSRYR
jgi:type I restriction enzyme M protein